MRLWSLHPQYLDAQGLIALWREGLLAQAVLLKLTKGYVNHPQLERFKSQPQPVAAIALYLQGVYQEALKRDYRFNQSKISHEPHLTTKIAVTQGQLDYELEHLRRKLVLRSPQKLQQLVGLSQPKAHPLFTVVKGPVASWEKRSS